MRTDCRQGITNPREQNIVVVWHDKTDPFKNPQKHNRAVDNTAVISHLKVKNDACLTGSLVKRMNVERMIKFSLESLENLCYFTETKPEIFSSSHW